ncbi:MAG: HDOD domain-containing protein [Gammaproteobacteria bacterium]
MKRILFVDDEPNILAGLKRMLMRQRREWDMHFAESGLAALDLLAASKPFDVVVSDMRMPVMQGYELLEIVAQKWPGASRLILSGHAEHESALRSAGVAHQFLSKPCDPDTLKRAVARTCALREQLAQNTIADALNGLGGLPVLPAAYQQIRDELSQSEPSMQNVADILASDIAMSTKILQLVNSSYFGLPRKIETINQAAMLLGLKTIRDLVLTTSVFRTFAVDQNTLDTEALWRHGRDAAQLVRKMCAAAATDTLTAGELGVAAFIQDVGQLALASMQPDSYVQVARQAEQTGDILAAENDVFGAQHPAAGAYILGLWGLPDSIVEAVYFHHTSNPPKDQASDEAGFIAIANDILAAAKNPDESVADELISSLRDTPFHAHVATWLKQARSGVLTEKS